MFHATPAQIAAFLRATADNLDTAVLDLGDDADLRVSVILSADLFAPEHERVATVHTLAQHLNLPADRHQQDSRWQYKATRNTDDGLHLHIHTTIDAPPKQCACGKTCNHAAADSTVRVA